MIKAPQPPSLAKLIKTFGGYDRITLEGWSQWDDAVAQWQRYIREGQHYATAMKNR
jgi:hypothetical protein